MVFDFVDNANMFNCPYSLHRLFNIAGYREGGLVLGKYADIKWDNDMFSKGEKPDVLIDYPVHALDYELIDLFNWQDQAKDMLSQMELTRRVSAQSETIVGTMKKTMKIEGMMCGHCEATVKKALEGLDGVTSAEVSHEAGTAVVELSADVADDVLKKTVEDKDYKVTAIN